MFFRFWLIVLVLKLVVSFFLPFSSDEAYYWTWSHNLQLSYFDHPPFISWLFWIGHPLEGWGNAVRWPGILFGHFILWFTYILFKKYFSGASEKWWLLVLILNPLTGWGSVVMTPDLPLIFFWLLSLLFLQKLVEEGGKKWGWLLGLSLGLGFCAKYQIVVFVPIALAWLIVSEKWRRLSLSSIACCFVTGLICCIPVLVWNYQNGFESFAFQLNHGLGAAHYDWRWTGEYVGGQVLLIFPILFYLALKKHPTPKEIDWLPFFSWGPLIFFGLSTLKGRSEANWPVAAYPCLLTLALLKSKNLKPVKVTVAFWTLVLILLSSHVIYPWIPVSAEKLKTSEFHEYDEIIPLLDSKQPLFASSLQMAASLHYKTKKPVYKLRSFGRKDVYDYMEESIPKTDHFFVVARTWDRLPLWIDKSYEVQDHGDYSKGLPKFRLIEVKKK